ncbi:MAG: DUF6477 family protein [Paracoccaceae bacterium]
MTTDRDDALAGETLRPRLLVMAATRVAETLARRGLVAAGAERAWLAEAEAEMEATRRERPFAWRAEAHVRVLGALIAARVSAAEEETAVAAEAEPPARAA